MRALTAIEMDAVSGGGNNRAQNLGQCVVDVVTAGAAGAAVGLLGGPVGAKIGAAAGMIGAVIGSNACNSGLK